MSSMKKTTRKCLLEPLNRCRARGVPVRLLQSEKTAEMQDRPPGKRFQPPWIFFVGSPYFLGV
ncbi:hypothetical protein [Paraburkholderia bannensis]|uniref:hypothetical protein n=1 Tax=Paraburkholderia bannensis TaxID=765414 RepID=UPI002ABDA4F8|nr:hypothetical protein [Paraburkholderia bannensis]